MNLFAMQLAMSIASATPVPATVDKLDDGSVAGHVHLDADLASVRAVLSDPVAVARWSPSVSSVELVAHGPCDTLAIAMRGWIVPMRVTASRCPTATGWELRLLDSNVFRDWGASWSVRETGDGVQVDYRLWSDLALPVTQGFVQDLTAVSMRKELGELVDRVATRRQQVPRASARQATVMAIVAP